MPANERESLARIGFGTLLERRVSTGPDVWQLISERTTIGGPKMARDAPDVTTMDSPEGWREFIPGLKDGGEVTVEGNFVPKDASQNAATGVLAEFSSPVRGTWRLTIPDGSPATVFSFKAIMTGFEPGMPVDDKMTYSATLKVSGKPTLA